MEFHEQRYDDRVLSIFGEWEGFWSFRSGGKIEHINNIFFLCSEFGKHAVDLLDLSYKDSALHAIASLDDKLPEFGNKTVTQVAQLCRNKYFIAHKSCQKWMMHRWHGVLRIREVDYRIFKLPEWVKVSIRLISLPVLYKIVS